jgi:putative glutamine amidotransferase
MPRRPLIGITLDAGRESGKYLLSSEYATSVEKAGGIPFPIAFLTDPALIPQILDRLDGILFTGGDDMDPARFGQTLHASAVPMNPRREEFEFALVEQAERRRLPTLGICLGCQVLNVHRGGDLHQFLPDIPREPALEHRRLERELPRHPVIMDLSTRLGRFFGTPELSVNTYHKQGINRLGHDLRVVAKAPDGIIEAIEDPALPLFVGVQWHPERLWTEKEHLRLFELLVASAGKYRDGE